MMSAMLWTFLTIVAADAPNQMRVSHPSIACWEGERTWTAPGEPLSTTIIFRTESEESPVRIAHNRDQIRKGREIEQDYNFLDYEFGSGADLVRARHYLQGDEVYVDLPGDALKSTKEGETRFPKPVLCYLQKRFRAIEVLTTDGYKPFWPKPK